MTMTTTKHTLGPWNVSASEPLDGSRIVHIGTTGTAIVLHENAEANARLIAAAPETASERDRLREINAELLAALQEARDALDGAPNTVGLHNHINAAITRAEAGK